MKIPDKWYIKRNKETMGEVNKYFSHLFNMTFSANGSWYDERGISGKKGYVYHDYLHFPKYDKKVKALLPEKGYQEISYETFLKYIVNKEKQTNMETLMGKKVKVTTHAQLNAANYIGEIGEVIIDNGTSVSVKFPSGETTTLGGPGHSKFPNEYIVVDDEPKGELVGYTILKDTPDVDAGTIGKLVNNSIEYPSKDTFDIPGTTNTSVYSIKFCEEHPEWFSPIYEDKIVIDGYEANINSSGVSFGCKMFSKEELNAYWKLLATTKSSIIVEKVSITLELLNKIISKIEKENV